MIKENFYLQLTANRQALGTPSYRSTLLEFCLRFWGRREKHRVKKMKTVSFLSSCVFFFLSSLTATFPLYQRLSLAGDTITQLIITLTTVQFKMCYLETSLAVQWLRICPAMQAMRVQSLVEEQRSHMLWGNSSRCCNHWASVLWSSDPLEPTCHSERSLRAATKDPACHN